MKKLLALCLAFNLTLSANAQTNPNDPVIFTVENVPVTVAEFKYIYQKTNGAKADFSRNSLEEYLDLYTKFKLKVRRARDMKLDTIESLREELNGYRRQLSDSYLTDREVTDKLVRQYYDFMQYDVSLSHILITTKGSDTIAAYGRIKEAKKQLDAGKSFEEVAKNYSEDKNNNTNGGFIGFLNNAMLPQGFYAFELAMYQASVGKYSDIVRTPYGYHILKVNAQRPARGEVEAAHILIRTTKDGVEQPDAKNRIDSIYKVLEGGGKFEDLAARLSEDTYTSSRNGYLGFFGVGRYELAFEDAAFNLAKDGDISAPFRSRIGWHIIKRINKKGILPFDQVKNGLKSKVMNDPRFEVAKAAMIQRIQRENKFEQTPSVLKMLTTLSDSTFGTYEWKVPNMPNNATLMSFGNDKKYSINEFVQYVAANPNDRVSNMLQTKSVDKTVETMYGKFVAEKSLAYEESLLDKKYPEFRALMREYEEGILLFEAIKQNVWDKAAQDSAGLEKFFATRRDKYMWKERAEVIFYALSDSAKTEIEALRKYAAKNTPQDVLKKFNKKREIVSYRQEIMEKGRNKVVDAIGFKVKSLSEVEINKKDNSLNFLKIEKVLPPTQKTLKEARGFVIADYQDFLEKQWIENLTNSYRVNVDRNVLNSLVK